MPTQAPPPRHIADSMRALCAELMFNNSINLPTRCVPFSIGKVIQLLNAKQCNVELLRDILFCSHGVVEFIEPDKQNIELINKIEEAGNLNNVSSNALILPHLLALTSYETGVVANKVQLLEVRFNKSK